MAKSIKKVVQISLFAMLLCTSCISSEKLVFGISNAKTVWFFFIIALVSLLMSFESYKPNFRPPLSALDILVYIWFFYLIANNWLHTGQLFSVGSIEHLGLLTTYLFFKRVFEDRKNESDIITVFLLLSCLQICIAYMQWLEFIPSYNSNFRITGFFFNPAPYAIYLSSFLAFCFSVLLYHSKRFFRRVAVCLFIAGLPVIFITFSRASWIALIVTVTCLTINRFTIKGVPIHFKNGYIKVSGVLVLFALIAVLSNYLYFQKKDSADGRLLIWKISSRMAQDRPLVGKGDGGMEAFFLKYQSKYFKEHPHQIGSEGRNAGMVVYAFNDIIQIIVEHGLMGIIIWLSLLFLWGKYSLKIFKVSIDSPVGRVVKRGFISSIAVIIIAGLFSYPMAILPIQIIFLCGLAYVASRYDQISFENKEFYVPIKRPIVINLIEKIIYPAGTLIFVFFGIISLIGYKLAVNASENEYNFSGSKKLLQYKFLFDKEPWFVLKEADYYLRVQQLSKAKELLEQAKTLSSDSRIYYTLGKLYAQQNDLPKAEEQYLFLYYALPSLMRPKYELAKFYFESKQKEKWKQYSKIVLDFNPRIESIYTKSMKSHIVNLNTSSNPGTY